MFGTTTRAQYFRIANGQIITGQGDNQQTGDFLEGVVTAISRRTIDSKTQKDVQGNPIKVVIFDLDMDVYESDFVYIVGKVGKSKFGFYHPKLRGVTDGV